MSHDSPTPSVSECWERYVEPSHYDWTWSLLADCYSTNVRRYHCLEHVRACLSLAERYDHTEGLRRMPHSDAVELALLWHDAVYVPGDKRNEELSARLLSSLEPVLTIDARVLEAAVAAILATQHHKGFGKDPTPSSVVVDTDLSILGETPTLYRVYSQYIKQEFAASVSADAWRVGRSAFLAGMLARPRIFHTDWAHKLFEAQARKNLHDELRALEDSR